MQRNWMLNCRNFYRALLSLCVCVSLSWFLPLVCWFVDIHPWKTRMGSRDLRNLMVHVLRKKIFDWINGSKRMGIAAKKNTFYWLTISDRNSNCFVMIHCDWYALTSTLTLQIFRTRKANVYQCPRDKSHLRVATWIRTKQYLQLRWFVNYC